MRKLLIGLVLAAVPIQGGAFCRAPYGVVSFPSEPRFLSKPTVPYCFNRFSYERTTCKRYEIDSYQREVQAYINAMQEYVDSAVEAANKAVSLAGEARAYAQCKINEVNDQIR